MDDSQVRAFVMARVRPASGYVLLTIDATAALNAWLQVGPPFSARLLVPVLRRQIEAEFGIGHEQLRLRQGERLSGRPERPSRPLRGWRGLLLTDEACEADT
jgi:hypothetical protein